MGGYLSKPSLVDAVTKGDLDEAKRCVVERGADVNAVDTNGSPVLVLAATRNDVHIVVFLLENGAAVDATVAATGETALFVAVAQRNVATVTCLLDHGAATTARRKSDGATALIVAATTSDALGMLQLLWERGAAARERANGSGHTAIMEAAKRGVVETVQWLAVNGANVNARNRDRKTALLLASAGGKKWTVRKLLGHGAETDVQDTTGNSALMVAASRGYVDIVQSLMVQGAKTTLIDTQGQTALMLASMRGHVPIVELLVVQRACVDMQDKQGQTALLLALHNDQKEIALALVPHVAHVDILDCQGRTALMLAAMRGYVEVVEMLLAKQARTDITDESGATALLLAAAADASNCRAVVENLLVSGADVTSADHEGNTALLHSLQRLLRDGRTYEQNHDEALQAVETEQREMLQAKLHNITEKKEQLQKERESTKRILDENRKLYMSEQRACKRDHEQLLDEHVSVADEFVRVTEAFLSRLAAECMHRRGRVKETSSYARQQWRKQTLFILDDFKRYGPSANQHQLIKFVLWLNWSAVSKDTHEFVPHDQLAAVLAAPDDVTRDFLDDCAMLVSKLDELGDHLESARDFKQSNQASHDSSRAELEEQLRKLEQQLSLLESKPERLHQMAKLAMNLTVEREQQKFAALHAESEAAFLVELKCLLDHGASYLQFNQAGESAKSLAKKGAFESVYAMLKDYEKIRATTTARVHPRPDQQRSSSEDWFIPPSAVAKASTVLACGGFGRVFRGQWMAIEVVVKEISVGTISKFLGEVNRWRSLRHDHVVPFYGANHREQPYFIVSKFASNGTLTTFLKAQPNGGRTIVWRKLAQVAAGLKYLHEKKIVHGDLRGDNIVVDEHGTAMVTDFGMSFDDDTSLSLQSNELGAMGWRAPEFATLSTTRPTLLADIYSLGMVCVEACTLENPWGKNATNTYIRACLKRNDIKVTIPEGMTPIEWETVAQMIRAAPQERLGMDLVLERFLEFARRAEVCHEVSDGWSA